MTAYETAFDLLNLTNNLSKKSWNFRDCASSQVGSSSSPATPVAGPDPKRNSSLKQRFSKCAPTADAVGFEAPTGKLWRRTIASLDDVPLPWEKHESVEPASFVSVIQPPPSLFTTLSPPSVQFFSFKRTPASETHTAAKAVSQPPEKNKPKVIQFQETEVIETLEQPQAAPTTAVVEETTIAVKADITIEQPEPEQPEQPERPEQPEPEQPEQPESEQPKQVPTIDPVVEETDLLVDDIPIPTKSATEMLRTRILFAMLVFLLALGVFVLYFKGQVTTDVLRFSAIAIYCYSIKDRIPCLRTLACCKNDNIDLVV